MDVRHAADAALTSVWGRRVAGAAGRRLETVAAKLRWASRKDEPGPAPAVPVRRDPVPPWRPFPNVGHIVLVGTIPAEYGGRTSSILNKCALLYEHGGVESLILTVAHSPYLPQAIESMRARGQLSEGVRVHSMIDFFPDHTVASQELPDPDDAVQGMTWAAAPESSERYYFDRHGHYRLHRIYQDGRLLIQDRVGDSGSRARREEFAADGRLLRTSFWEPGSDARRQDIFYRRNGAPMFNHATSPPATKGGYSKDDRVVLFDEHGSASSLTAGTFAPVVHACLDSAIGDRPTVLSVEARFVDRYVLGYERPNVRKVFVLHSSHLKPPGTQRSAIRPTFVGLLGSKRADRTIVFLTDGQRADAEAHLGRQERFVVIPHSSASPRLEPGITREPALAVMVGRLSKEKRMEDAITAFAEVVISHPDARLEIYGEGPERSFLQRRITAAGLGEHVKLMGFTHDVGRVFQRASVCLLTSVFEGAPLVLVEALRHGCPVISYDIRYGPSDIVEEGVNGILVPAGSTAELAGAINRVFGDPALCLSLAAGCARAEGRFGHQAFVGRWSALFNELASSMASEATSSMPLPLQSDSNLQGESPA